MTSRTSTLLRIAAVLLIAAELALFFFLHKRFAEPVVPGPLVMDGPIGAVPELSRQRHLMVVAERALREGDGRRALAALEAASFESRPVEVYRRYYLANAHELVGNRREARKILATLRADDTPFVRRIDATFHLAELYESEGDLAAAASVLVPLMQKEAPVVTHAAYQQIRRDLIAAGEVTVLVELARDAAVRQAATPLGERAAADLDALGVVLSRKERIERATSLAVKGDPKAALAEIEMLRQTGSTLQLERARAETLARLGRRDDADKIVTALVGQNESVDRTLLGSSWGWWSAEADAIESRAWRSIRVRRRSGSTRVRVGGRWVTRPTYTTVTRRVRRSLGRADRRRLTEVNAKLIDRGEHLLRLGVEEELERQIHRRLAVVETTPRRQAKLEEHLRSLIELDPSSDDRLQLFWDEGWAAWRNGDLDTARERFAFIYRVYRLPNITRQARYWYARCLEASGETAEASRHYRELQSAPYDDVYSLLARSRSEADDDTREPFVPFSERNDDWVVVAEREMPDELRLAWELSLLGLNHDARMEVRANTSPANRSWAYSILARIHRAESSPLLVGHTLRIAWPEIGTVDQDRVPVHFLKMYYPTRYHDVIEREAARHSLDAALVKGLVLQESAYDPQARSSAGATGLMQLMAPTAREFAPRVGLEWDEPSLKEPDYNVTIGTRYLRSLLTDVQGNPVLALASYNGGPGNVRRWLRGELKGRSPDEVIESIPFSETRSYVKRVILYRSVYARLRSANGPRDAPIDPFP